MTNLKWVPPLAVIGAICGCATAPKAQVQAGASLPVYEIVKAGASDADAAALADQLKIPAKALVSAGGMLSYVDPERYLAAPTSTVPESPLTARLRDATRNKDAARPVDLRAIDTDALAKMQVLDTQAALDSASRGLEACGLQPQFGAPVAGHTVLTLYSRDASGGWTSKSKELDTQVAYRFSEPGGHPLIGPGAQVQVTYDGAGRVSRLHYATRQLKQGASVSVISEDEARKRIANHVPAGARITTRLVYWSPPLQGWLGRAEGPSPAAIIPWYAFFTSTEVKDQKTGLASVVKSRVQMIPATDDARFVPAVQLTASAQGSEVSARVSVSGGTPPYTYLWAGSDPEASRNTGESARYTASARVADAFAQDEHFRLDRNETVSVTVIDANGVAVHAHEIIPVHANPVVPRPRLITGASYGCESPNDPGGWTPARIAWQNNMGTSGAGGGTQSYCWLGGDAWPGDFIEPNPPGTLVATPWVYGDADYSDWGVNTADIVLDNADGNPDQTVVMQPGAPVSDYPTSVIQSPNNSLTVEINLNGYGGSPTWYSVPYAGSWGPVGPNDTLCWLLLDDCEMLDATDGSGLNVAQRWGPAFNGLHVLTGFASLAYGNGAFEGTVATNLLGVYGAPQTIVQSWFNSAESTGAGTPAAMGPALYAGGPFTMVNLNDYYWGKGSVGATIVPQSYPVGDVGWWYLTSTVPATVVFE